MGKHPVRLITVAITYLCLESQAGDFPKIED